MRLLLTIFCVIISSFSVRASAIGEETMVHLTLTDGLAGEAVKCMITDHMGIVWIGTSSGVNAYNGWGLQTYRIKGRDNRFLMVNDLCETSSHEIYAATEEGLYRLKMGESVFHQFLPEIKDAQCLLAAGDTVYIGSQQGLMVWDGTQLQHVDIDISRSGVDNVVKQYVRDNDGQIWFLSRSRLNRLDSKTKKITHYPLPKHHIVTQFACLTKNRFVVGTHGDGLLLFDVSTKHEESVSGGGNIISTVNRCADGSICVATDGTGAYRLDGKTLEVIERFSMESDEQHRLPSNGVNCYYRDINGVNWFGFARYGLVYTYHCGDLFRPFQIDGFTTSGINVRTYYRHDADIVIGTQNGFYYVNQAKGLWKYFPPEEIGGGHIVNSVCWYDGKFYIGTFDGGLRVFDPQKLQVTDQHFSPLLDHASIGDLKVSPDGKLWVASTYGLMIMCDGKLLKHFTEQNSHIVGGFILSITFDSQGNAWLTGAKGCSLYSANSHGIVKPAYPEGFFHQQPWMRGARGHDGLIFMRTGPQTFYTNEKMTDFGELQLPVKFIDKWCRNFADDMHGHYFLTSEYGVFAFTYDLKGMASFGYGEGLRGDYINDMGIQGDSCLWVATSQGLFLASQSDYQQWKRGNHYKTLLFQIRKGSDLLTSGESYLVNEERYIRLGWNITSEALQLTPFFPDFTKQTGRWYEYRLDNGKWYFVNGEKTIDIRGLLLGTHRLEVRLAGADFTSSVYQIVVVPTGWAIFELILLVLSSLLFILWWRYRKYTKVVIEEHKLTEQALIEENEERQESGNDVEKYQRAKLSDSECSDIVKRMRHYLETEHAYRNPDLKRANIADAIQVSPVKLSQVFTLYLKENYYDFINRYRLEEFKKLVEAGECQKYTVTAISERCGFRKSSFFATFRKVEGMTPTEYLSKKNIKIS